MRIYKSSIAKSAIIALSGLGLSAVSTTALAGGCGGYGAPNMNCAPNVVVVNSTPRFDQTTVNIRQPMGHLRSIHYNQVPQVSIMRVHSMPQSVSLADRPNGFTGGCNPQSTGYCRSHAGQSAHSVMATPQFAPQPAPQPVFVSPPAAPTFNANSQPRQYGENTFVPGIAHVPTSYVDRSVENNQAVLNSGQTVAQSTTLGGMAPGYGQMQSMAQTTQSYTTHHSQVVAAPTVQAPQGTPYSSVAADGTYWEQTSGPTMIDGTMATQVLCKRQAPMQTVQPLPVRVVRPVIGVPVPVPVSCAGMPIQNAGMPVMAGGPVPARNGWTF